MKGDIPKTQMLGQEPMVDVEDPFVAAAYWHGILEEEDEPELEQIIQFERWVTADPANSEAYKSVLLAWDGIAAVGVNARILSMRSDALTKPQRRKSGSVSAVLVAATVLFAALVIGYEWRRHAAPSAGEYATRLGERSTLHLADGSTVVLNTESRVRVAIDSHIRLITLLAGQAWFEVSKNREVPFVVEAGNRRVIAHGTAFDVRLENQNQVQVTLVEGRVSVESVEPSLQIEATAPDLEDLLPGDQLVATSSRHITRHVADLAQATSWREGQIIIDNETLAAAVAEVNRYLQKKIVVVDPRLAALRMSGVFVSGHTESFLETITESFPVTVISTTDGKFLITAKE